MTKLEKISAEKLSRRGVLKGMGAVGGLVLGMGMFTQVKASDVLSGRVAEGAAAGVGDGLFLQIDNTGRVHITIHRQEMGQGSRTGLPQIIADELDADWDRINFIQGLGDKRFGDQNTDGSTSIRGNFDRLRLVGATARLMLRQAAAQAWGVSLSEVAAENHKLINKATGDSADYGAFADAAGALPMPKPEDVPLKTKAEWRYINTGKQIIDMQGIITGTADFGQDVRLDNMLYAVVARPPVVGGKVSGYNKDAAMAVAGVVDVIDMPALDATKPVFFQPLGGVAVVATNTWAALKGREALAATFEGGANAAYSSGDYEKTLWDNLAQDGTIALKRGDTAAGLKAADKVLTADYFVPHLVHAPMEPPAATAYFAEDGTLDVYTHGQDPQTVQQTCAPYAGLEPTTENIRVHSKLLGGAFGRKSKPDFAAEATILAKQKKQPVKVVWTREDDVRHSYYHAVSAQRVAVGLDADGTATSWHHKAAYPSIFSTFGGPAVTKPVDFELGLGLLDLPFDCANMAVEACDAPAHVRIGWLRSVANIHQSFAVGSMVDELAEARGVSTYDQWMQMIGSDRLINPADDNAKFANYNETLDRHPIDTARIKAVLARVKDMSGYGKKLPKGHGMGISVQRSFVSYVACVMEVVVEDDGTIKTPRAWMAVDCGIAVNTDRVKAQMEGAVNFGLSIAKYGKITAEQGAIVEGNFDGYELVRIADAPYVDVDIIESDAAPGGVGEPGVPPVAPAFTNALFQATGKRFRRLPVGDSV